MITEFFGVLLLALLASALICALRVIYLDKQRPHDRKQSTATLGLGAALMLGALVCLMILGERL